MLSPVADNLTENRSDQSKHDSYDGDNHGTATGVVPHWTLSNATSLPTKADPLETLLAQPSWKNLDGEMSKEPLIVYIYVYVYIYIYNEITSDKNLYYVQKYAHIQLLL
jgi:hypothetical protein